MKKWLCMVMAAVMVVMIVPVRAGAVSGEDLAVRVRGGVPEITGSVTSFGSDDLTWPEVSYEIVLPVSVDVYNMPVGKYINGFFSINTSLFFSGLSSANYYYAGIKDISFSPQYSQRWGIQ